MVKNSTVLLVDGHVHFYACFDPDQLLDAAWSTLEARARASGCERWRGVLLLTESRRDAVFEELATLGMFKGRRLSRWTAHQTEETETLRLASREGRELQVVSGFQVATKEDLEVLAIGTRQRVPDGQEFFETYRQVSATGAFPVVPWGFGKWTLGRGKTIRRLLDLASPQQVGFGDNGGRIAGLPRPGILKLAERRRFAILPGTDPLPFPDQGGRVGTSGFVLPVDDDGRPAAAIKSALRSGTSPAPFMQLTSPAAFATAQVRMQLRKRFG